MWQQPTLGLVLVLGHVSGACEARVVDAGSGCTGDGGITVWNTFGRDSFILVECAGDILYFQVIKASTDIRIHVEHICAKTEQRLC